MSNYDEIQYLHKRIDILEQANDIMVTTLHELVDHINDITDLHYTLYANAPARLQLDTIYLDELEPED